MSNSIDNKEQIEEHLCEEEVSLDKVYKFPTEIVVKKINNIYLVIYTEGCLWLVFNEQEFEVFKMLQKNLSITQVMEHFNEDVVINTITQIEAKKFERPIIKKETNKNMYIYLTNNCNERCNHCYMYSGEFKFEELTVSQWKKVISDFKNCGGKGITFTGGEVTVYKGFEEIIKYTHNIGIHTTVLTNGVLWDQNLIESIYKYIDEIQVSIDGYDRESYINVRNFDGFENAIETIVSFYKLGTRVSMAVTPLYEGIDCFVEKFEKFALSFISKYPNIFIKISFELLNGRNIKSDDVKNLNYENKIRKLVESIYPNYYIETFVLNYKDSNIRENCGFGEISIAPNGDVYWCNRIHELESSYNIKNTSMIDIIKKSEEIKEGTNVKHSQVCSKCDIKYICGGGCRMKYPDIIDCNKKYWENRCTSEYKEKLYERMIASNEYFYLE